MAEVSVTRSISREPSEPASPEQQEAVHREAEARVQPFVFARPADLPPNTKTYHKLASTPLVSSEVQIVPEGGENNLHYHTGEDGFWMVLRGRVRFHGPDGPTGEYGPMEGVLMPRNARYWFEAVECGEELQILHVAGRQPRDNRRMNVTPRVKRGLWIDPVTGESKIGAPDGN